MRNIEMNNEDNLQEQKKLQEKIEQAARAWRATLDAIKDLVWIADKDCHLLRVNQAYANFTGIAPKQLIGETCQNVFSWSKVACPDCPHKHTIATGDSTIKEFFEPQRETYLEIASSPILDETGEVTASVCVARDITVSKHAQDRIEQAARGWRATLDAIKDLVWIADKDCHLLRVNQPYADFTGIAPKQLIGEVCQNVFPWSKVACPDCPHKHTIMTGESAIKEFFEPGQGTYLEIASSPISNEKGKVTASVCVARDITIRKKAERIESELSVATDIQNTMLPRLFPAFPARKEFDIYATMKPAKEVGGDLYDLFFITENKLCFLIGDVSGKGIPAALFMAIGKTLLRTEAMRGYSPGEVLSRVNNVLCPDNDTNMFITVFCAILDTETGNMQFANGGHNPPLLCTGEYEYKYMQIPNNVALGIMPDIDYKCQEVNLKPNDIVFLYTDGVTEAVNLENLLFSEARLKQHLSNMTDRDTKNIILKIGESIETFAQRMPQADDITMLALKYKGNAATITRS